MKQAAYKMAVELTPGGQTLILEGLFDEQVIGNDDKGFVTDVKATKLTMLLHLQNERAN